MVEEIESGGNIFTTTVERLMFRRGCGSPKFVAAVLGGLTSWGGHGVNSWMLVNGIRRG